MAQLLKSTFLLVTALFPIVNPLGSAPLFLSLTHYYSPAERKILSSRIAFNSVALIVVQVGGGLVLASSGWALLKQKDEDTTKTNVHRTVNADDLSRRAFYPLTLPLTVGPGSISVAITLGANERHSGSLMIYSIVGAIIGSLLIAASVYLCYAFADRLARALGETAMSVIMRLSSFLLVCIGVQIIWNGLSSLLKSIPGLM